MGLEQYAGMSTEDKLMTLLVKMDNLEKFVLTKPCPSPECVKCRADVADLMLWRARRVAELEAQAEQENEAETREAWVVPMWVAVGVSVVSMTLTLIIEMAS